MVTLTRGRWQHCSPGRKLLAKPVGIVSKVLEKNISSWIMIDLDLNKLNSPHQKMHCTKYGWNFAQWSDWIWEVCEIFVKNRHYFNLNVYWSNTEIYYTDFTILFQIVKSIQYLQLTWSLPIFFLDTIKTLIWNYISTYKTNCNADKILRFIYTHTDQKHWLRNIQSKVFSEAHAHIVVS